MQVPILQIKQESGIFLMKEFVAGTDFHFALLSFLPLYYGFRHRCHSKKETPAVWLVFLLGPEFHTAGGSPLRGIL